MELQARWDLTEIFKNETEFLSKLKTAETIIEKIQNYNKSVKDNPKNICDFFELEDLIFVALGKFETYIDLLKIENIKNPNLETLDKEFRKTKDKIKGYIKEVKLTIASSDIEHLLKIYPNLFKYIDKIEDCLDVEEIGPEYENIYLKYENLMNKIYEKNENEINYSKEIADILNSFFTLFAEEYDSLDDEAFAFGFETRDLYKMLLKMKSNNFLNSDLDKILDISNTRNIKTIKLPEAKSIVLNSLSVLGNDYVNEVKNNLTSKRIDYYPRKYKSYREVTYFHPLFNSYASINFKNDMNSLSTLAHELGHMVDFNMKEEKVNSFVKSTSIFSEFPSLLNELIVSDSLYKCANTLDEKIDVLYNILDLYFTNLIMCAVNINYFTNIFKEVQNGNQINDKKLNTILFRLNRKYNLNFSKNEWATFDFSPEIFSASPYLYGITGATKALYMIKDKTFDTKKYIEILKTNDEGLTNFKHLGCNPYKTLDFTLSEMTRLIENFKDLLYEKEKGLIKKWK